VYVGTDEARVFAYDRETGDQRWQCQNNYEVVTSAAIADGRLVYGDEFGNLVCLS
jgi:outer membrane protein assembly factor BamB